MSGCVLLQYNKYDVVGGIAIMTAHGCRVLPYLPSRSPPSRESMEYIVFKEPLHVYMDTYGTASPNGVIKVRLSPLPPSPPPSLSVRVSE